MKFSVLIYIIIGMLLLNACGNKTHINETIEPLKDNITAPAMEANQMISQHERELINEFVHRKQWDMTETGTGVRYGIYYSEDGVEIESGDIVELEYTLELLDGTLISKTEEGETETVLVDKDIVESGLHEALKHLHQGDRAKVIIPSHMAFGLTGDLDKIPGFSTLVYDLKIIDVRVDNHIK